MTVNRAISLIARNGKKWIFEATNNDLLMIGRRGENDVAINDPSVSRNHARFWFDGDDCFIEDLGSRNGTYVNRIRLRESTRIHNGDSLQVGSVELLFEDARSCLVNQSERGTSHAEPDTLSRRIPESISPDLLAKLKAGDKDAANLVIGACFERVAKAARRRLNDRRLRGTGSQDIAASVLESLWKKIDLQQFTDDQLATGDEFWRLLCTMIRFKTEDHVRREHAAKRGGGDVRGESVFIGAAGIQSPGLASQANPNLSAAEITALKDQYEQMMEVLGDVTLQEVVTLRMEDYSVSEIAEHFGKSDRWVKRRLADVREKWTSQVDSS